MKHISRGTWALVAVAVVVVLVAGLAVWTLTRHHEPARINPAPVASANEPRDIGEGVTVSDNAPQDLSATDVNGAGAPFKLVTAVSPVLEISGPSPTEPFKLNFPVTSQVADDDTVVVATAESVNGPWTLTAGDVWADGKTVTVETDHLSYWQVLRVDVKAATDGLNDDLLKAFAANRRTGAHAPQCDGVDAALADGYTVNASAEQALHRCFGLEDGQRVLKVVNRFSYSVQVSASGLTSLDQDASGDTRVLQPFGQVQYKVALKPGETGSLRAENSDQALAEARFELSLRLIGSILARFGVPEGDMGKAELTPLGFDQLATFRDKLRANKACADAVASESADDIIRICYNRESLQTVFGSKSLLLAPVLANSHTIGYLGRAFDELEGRLTGTPVTKINVQRSDEFNLGWLKGEWVSCSGPGEPHHLYTNSKGLAEWIQGKTVRKLRLYRQNGGLFGEVTESRRGPDLTGQVLSFRQIDDGGVQMATEGLYVDFYHHC